MYGNMQESGLIEIIPLIGPLTLGPVSCSFPSCILRVAAVAEGLAEDNPFVSILSSLSGLMAATAFVY